MRIPIKKSSYLRYTSFGFLIFSILFFAFGWSARLWRQDYSLIVLYRELTVAIWFLPYVLCSWWPLTLLILLIVGGYLVFVKVDWTEHKRLYISRATLIIGAAVGFASCGSIPRIFLGTHMDAEAVNDHIYNLVYNGGMDDPHYYELYQCNLENRNCEVVFHSTPDYKYELPDQKAVLSISEKRISIVINGEIVYTYPSP